MTTDDRRTRTLALLRDMRVYVLVTTKFCNGSPVDAARQAIEGGADVVQLREKDMDDRDLLALAGELREICAGGGVLFIVNDRPDIAVLSDADGVHLGQDDLAVADARAILLPHQIVGVSTHCIEQARQAVADGADYLGVGPVFPTKTKGYEHGVGTESVAEVAGELDIPFVALGGVTIANAGDVARAGARAVAVCTAVVSAPNIAEAAADLRRAMEQG